MLHWGRPHPNPPPVGEGIILLGESDRRAGGLPVLFLFWGKGRRPFDKLRMRGCGMRKATRLALGDGGFYFGAAAAGDFG